MNFSLSVDNLSSDIKFSGDSGTPAVLYFSNTLAMVYYGTFFSFLAHKHWRHLGPVHMFELKGLWDMTVCRIVDNIYTV